MSKFQFFMSAIAVCVLTWRVIDPKGSYTELYDLLYFGPIQQVGWEALLRIVVMAVLDHLNAFLAGIIIGCVLQQVIVTAWRLVRGFCGSAVALLTFTFRAFSTEKHQ